MQAPRLTPCVPTVPVVVLLWSLGGSRAQHNRKRSHVSLPNSSNTPRESIKVKVVLPSHAVHATYLCFFVRG